jgi:pyridoxal phosphate phosphatase PHOSPHO2
MERHGGWESFARVMYVGDGGNDFCPLLRLREQDIALVRSYRELSRRITKEAESSGMKCQTEYWGGAWEVEKILMDKIEL